MNPANLACCCHLRKTALLLVIAHGCLLARRDAAASIASFAGIEVTGFAGDGGPAKGATFNGPKQPNVATNAIVFLADREAPRSRVLNVGAHSDAALPRVFRWDANQLAAARERLRAGEPSLVAALASLKQEADELLRSKLVSVMDKRRTPPSGDKHDYMSQAPYFWPDPRTTNGLPYIRRDGERNPEINKLSDHGNILAMPEKVQTLALAFYFTGEETYANKAAQFLRAWFLDPATRMNPHFEFAQAIPGVNTGRGIGLIESRNLVKVVDAVGLLHDAKAWSEADERELEKWFADFLDWMRTSKKGRDERAAKNNHGTYYDVQVVSFALFTRQREFALQVLASARTNRIAVQIQPDGRQPLELVRTKAWSYSTGNLSGLFELATLGERLGIDLWHYETPDGRSLRRALDYLVPFAAGEQKWPHQQLGGWSPSGIVPLLREALRHYPEPSYRQLLDQLANQKRRGWKELLQPAS